VPKAGFDTELNRHILSAMLLSIALCIRNWHVSLAHVTEQRILGILIEDISELQASDLLISKNILMSVEGVPVSYIFINRLCCII
jgi:hypothetical protein